jgi:hypothetical protein
LPGFSNPLLVRDLFQDYSSPWIEIARNHIKDVCNTTKRFLELILQYLIDKDICDNIVLYWLDDGMSQRLEEAKRKLDELLEVHEEYPFTTNPDFVDIRRKLQ